MKAWLKTNLFLFISIFAAFETQASRWCSPSTGKWFSRDPIEEPGFLNVSMSASSQGPPSGGRNEPNLYAFVLNDPLTKVDPNGLVTVGFYGANTWFSPLNDGNVKMKEIAASVGAPIYRSLDIWDAYKYLLEYFQNAGGCNNNEPIKIFGHSWGGISAVKLSRWIGQSALRNHETDVFVIDPVSHLRTRPITVPSNVKYFWNRYETAGNGVYIVGFGVVHGRALPSNAQYTDQVNLNPSDPNGLDHFTIIDAVRDDLINLLQ